MKNEKEDDASSASSVERDEHSRRVVVTDPGLQEEKASTTTANSESVNLLKRALKREGDYEDIARIFIANNVKWDDPVVTQGACRTWGEEINRLAPGELDKEVYSRRARIMLEYSKATEARKRERNIPSTGTQRP